MDACHQTMATIICALLLFLAQLHTLPSTSSSHHANITVLPIQALCQPDQANALLQLKKSFSFVRSTTRLSSWQDGTDCCLWEGVSCDASSGNVTVLDLNNRALSSRGFDQAIFNLASLRRLDLSMNDFSINRDCHMSPDSMLDTQFERFTLLTHLNLSNSGLDGQIPIGINNELVNLVSLDLSSSFDYMSYEPYSIGYFNNLVTPDFHMLLASHSNLRELYLDGVQMGIEEEDGCRALATSVPRLQVLSLAYCKLGCPIHKYLSSHHSLAVLNLQGNNYMTAGPFPEFFMDFLNLSVLQLSGINLEGRFPPRSFRSKSLRVLDLSANSNLSGHVPNFSNASSLETLRLEGTNFSYSKPTSSINFELLKDLGLSGNLVSVDFLSYLGRPGSLRQLDLNDFDSENMWETVFSWIGDLKNLKSLAFTRCDFSKTTPFLVSNLRTLITLTMDYCNVPTSIFSAIGNLKDLQTLEMNTCTTYGSMPSSIGNLTNLRNIRIFDCGFSGPMPAAVGNLTNLETMAIIRNDQFSGAIPYAIGHLNKLTSLDLEDCNFSGKIPSSIVNLTQLTALYLSDNYLNGEIPSIFTLPVLRDMDLSWNQLTGPVPEFDTASSKLEYVDLSNNALSGEIPSIFTLPVLRRMDLSWNQLTGPVQEFNTAYSKLEYVDLSNNGLSGLVNLTLFWRLSKLASLDLSNSKLSVMEGEVDSPLPSDFSGPSELVLVSCNITRFPRSLAHIKYLSSLDLSDNEISGNVPNWIWESSSLKYLNLSHNKLNGILELASYVLPSTTTLDSVDLSFNSLRGRIPMPKSSAFILDYSNNRFSSFPPDPFFQLGIFPARYFSVSKNNISGHIPPSICYSVLDVLDLSYNNLSGQIPHCLIENLGIQLMVLNLRGNHIEGRLPSLITSKCSLQFIDLHGNKIEGPLPRALSNCTDLEVLDLGSNRIVDTFPSWLSRLSKLSVIILRSNQFYGTIGDIDEYSKHDECFPGLQIIDLASNNFSGNLRSQWFERLKSMMTNSSSIGKSLSQQEVSFLVVFYEDSIEITYKGSSMTFQRVLTTLIVIDFSNNRLEGTIPGSIGRLVSLHLLNMSHNAFTGKIPTQLGGMTDLESLDLSCNQLSGEIPQELTDLTFLGSLNLSYNHLVGKIPQSRQLSTFDSSSFEGNAGLCGPQLPKFPCGASPYTPSAEHVGKSSHHVDVVLFLFVGLGFGIGFAAAIVVEWNRIGRWFIATTRACRT